MEITYAFLCDYADTSGGKLAAFGIGLDTIYAQETPVTHHLLHAVIGFRFTSVETGQKRLGLRLIDADGKAVLPPVDMTITVQEPPPGYGYRSQRLALALRGIRFSAYGDYAAVWLVDGREVHRCPLKVAPVPPRAGQG